MKLLREYVRKLILEFESGGIGVQQQVGYGKNYHTVNPLPITWQNYEGLEYDISAGVDGDYYATVKILDYPNLEIPTRVFTDEATAQFWVRNLYEKLHQMLMNEPAAK